ncbi:Uma2 family endonuclease [Actinophytocola algeriensis]|uniref:Putative restriction endonuclease domain-containing protein n=1 Tax=Actinophytocola algeriensis TaxID=1768010 RepID=A0A7W7Q3R4_9PSEU|nr:Uma2 family endonuclease [Actinophytocola algeriensis]MBB4906353.1 hypothetical protein [Actinophytocola algeriensis]MBE1477834.1 hypothetical protein [Actinophytocola algeriensis]
MAKPSPLHNLVARNMANVLDSQIPSGWATATDFDLKMPSGDCRSPDFAIVREEAATAKRPLRLDEVLLVGEVVSPSWNSIHKDIYQYPRLFLEAGLVHYWHIHLDPVFAIYAHRLGRSQVRHHTPISLDVLNRNPGRFIFDPQEPFPFQIDLAQLIHSRASLLRAMSNIPAHDPEADYPAAEVTVKVDRVDGILVPLARPGALVSRPLAQ